MFLKSESFRNSIFKDMNDAYSFKLSFKWPFMILNRKYLQRMQKTTLDRMSTMYSKLHELLRKHQTDDYLNSTRWENTGKMFKIMQWELGGDSKESIIKDYEILRLEEYAYKTLKSSAFSYS
jgi:hypothetical protein